MDKIKGAWAGQTIGCTYGAPTEFWYNGVMIHDTIDIKWPDGQIKWYYENNPGMYDDVYMDITWARKLELFYKYDLEEGPHVMTFNWRNPEPDKHIDILGCVVYGTKE